MSSTVKLSLIFARAKNGVIGKDGKLPWRLKSDLLHFKKTTMDCPILMGRKTWESLPKRPLPGRMNVVMTRDWDYDAPGARVYSSFPAAIHATKAIAARDGQNEVFVIGGEMIYELAMPMADRLYITEIDANVDGDASFPAFDESEWTEVSTESFAADDTNEFAYTFRTLERA